MNRKNKLTFIGILLFCAILILFYIYGTSQTRLLNKCFHKTEGKIIGTESGYRGGLVLRYQFKVGGKLYNDDIRTVLSGTLREKFADKYLIVVYSCANPNLHRLIFNTSDYEDFNIVYPDSLKWIQSSIDNNPF